MGANEILVKGVRAVARFDVCLLIIRRATCARSCLAMRLQELSVVLLRVGGMMESFEMRRSR